MMRPLETTWANYSEKLHGLSYEREAATSQSLTETCKIHSQVTQKVEAKAVGSVEERFIQEVRLEVRLASCDLDMKTGGGQVFTFPFVPYQPRKKDEYNGIKI
jgi:hypothetical protein